MWRRGEIARKFTVDIIRVAVQMMKEETVEIEGIQRPGLAP
jgi:hypothetical protein